MFCTQPRDVKTNKKSATIYKLQKKKDKNVKCDALLLSDLLT